MQPLPTVPSPARIQLDQWRYYLNFCTTSYSFAFASLQDWLDEVDWMALHGINMPLATAGTEHVEALAYGALGLTEAELEDFFPGVAFLAWNRMANMDGPFGGPLSPGWRERKGKEMALVYQRL